MEQMVTVLNRLSEIEAAAVNVEKQSADERDGLPRNMSRKPWTLIRKWRPGQRKS